MSRPIAAGRLPACLGMLLAGCATVGPDYTPPPLPAGLQAAGAFAEQRPAAFTAAPLPQRWWRLYQNPQLDAAVEEALVANTDVRVAAANLERAQAVATGERAAAGVQTSLGGGLSAGQTSNLGLGSSAGVHGSFDAGLGVSYTVDAVGQIRRRLEAVDADADAHAAAADLARISVVANVVGAYTEACASGARWQVAAHSVALQQQSLALAERGAHAGLYSPLEVTRSRALLAQLQAEVAPFEGARQAALYRLAVLMGRAPTNYPAALADCKRIPTLAQPLPAGDGAAMIRRRPDIRQAERELAAATADIGVVTANLYPSIRLGASLGSTSRQFGHLLDGSALRFSAGPLIAWSFPNTRVVHTQIEQAGAAQRAALSRFDGVVLTSLQEAETALTLYARHLDQNVQLRDARDESRKADELQNKMLRGGTVSRLEALDVERSLASAQAALAASDATLTQDRVRIFLALGGGWETDPTPADPLHP